MAEQQLDPLELEHMMGFDGASGGSVQYHPKDPAVMISFTGCLLVISDVNDPHQQEFLRGHNEAISCLALSPSGAMIASGQTSTTRVPNSEAMVIVWDYASRQPLYRLMELHDGIAFSRNRVRQLAFSPDDLFLAGSDDQPGGAKLCVWHTNTGQLATIAKTAQRELAFLAWGEVIASRSKTQKQSSYQLQTAAGNKVMQYTMEFDVHNMQFGLKQNVFQLPSAGLDRLYHCATTVCTASRAWFLVAGSSAGELCVFNAQTMVFRACVPVSKGGLLSLAVRDAGEPFGDGEATAPLAYCGLGDGTLKLLQGEDLQWTCLAEAQLDGEVRSVTVSSDGQEVLAGTSLGNIYRLDARDLRPLAADGSVARSYVPLLASHPHPISVLDFGGSSEWFLTASESGHVRRWELSNYSVDWEAPPPTKTCDAYAVVRAECLAVDNDSLEALTGWTDGNVRCYSAQDGAPLWEIVGAHRGGVSCVVKCPLYMVSGGADGAVRIWGDGPSRAMMGNFDEHTKRVTSVQLDKLNQKVVHSCGEDKKLVSIDLDQSRRVKCQTVKEGAMRSMVQMDRGEYELITADTSGALKWWDSDYDQPVSMMLTWSPQQDPNKDRRLTHIDISPPTSCSSSDFLLACTSSGEVQVWDLHNSALVSIGSAHSDEVTMAKWSPDGKQVVSVGKDACICVWNWYGDGPPGDGPPPQ